MRNSIDSSQRSSTLLSSFLSPFVGLSAMNFLCHGKKVDEETMKENEWMDLFDVVVVGSCTKPACLLDNNLSLFRVCAD